MAADRRGDSPGSRRRRRPAPVRRGRGRLRDAAHLLWPGRGARGHARGRRWHPLSRCRHTLGYRWRILGYRWRILGYHWRILGYHWHARGHRRGLAPPRRRHLGRHAAHPGLHGLVTGQASRETAVAGTGTAATRGGGGLRGLCPGGGLVTWRRRSDSRRADLVRRDPAPGAHSVIARGSAAMTRELSGNADVSRFVSPAPVLAHGQVAEAARERVDERQ